MPEMFDPNKPVPKEVLDAMVGVSTKDDERKDLDRQLMLAHELMKGATGYRNMPGQRAVGGIANAAAQGMQGYMGGTQMAEDAKRRAELIASTREARGKFAGLAGAQMPGMSSPSMQAPFNPNQDPYQ